MLLLNVDKTIFVLIGSKYKLLPEVGDVEIILSTLATILDVIVDEHMAGFPSDQRTGFNWKVLNVENTKILVYGYMLFRQDNCNACFSQSTPETAVWPECSSKTDCTEMEI